MNFSERSCTKCLISWKSTRNHRFGQNYATFSNKLPCFGVSMNFSAKGCKKLLNSWKSTKSHPFAQNFATFRTNYHVFAFRWTFQEKVAKSASFREKARKLIHLAKTMQLFEQTTIYLHFDELFRRKLHKVPHFVKKHEKPSIWPKLSTFRANYHVLAFSWTFKQEVSESASFRGKAREMIDLAKTMQLFRTNYHVFPFRSTFREMVAKSAPFRETARKIIDLAKALTLLEQATMSFSFWWTFKKKVAKCASSREKARKSSILSTCNFPRKLPCFDVSMNIAAKSCKKLLVPWKSTKNHRFGQIFATFRANYHVLAFRWSFQQKVTKSASFREKARKIVDLAKTRNFSNKLPCFDALVNFSAKSCRKGFVFWENSTNHRLGQNLQLFEQTTMFWHFDELFRKKMQKLARLVKKHEHSSIWPKLATSRRNYHVLAFRWLLQEKVAKRWKKWLISWKMTKNHRFGLNLQLFEETTMFRRFCQLFSKKWVISWKSTKNRHSEVA